ncbi:MAG: leucine-rich repeat domain-containing protein [Thermoplasmata archaeon]|nr:leucine-rich repeat domain-containing protein [Thermoplasmata archaeon]
MSAFLISSAMVSADAEESEADDSESEDQEPEHIYVDDGDFSYRLENGYAVAVQYNGVDDEVSIPEKMTYEGTSYTVWEIECVAFFQNEPSRVIIPKTVENLWAPMALSDSLRNIDVDPANPKYASRDGVLYDKDFSSLIKYPNGKPDESFAVPESVVTIESSAFNESKLKSISTGDKVRIISDYAFSGCTQLSGFNEKDGINHLPDRLHLIGYAAFRGCSSLEQITFPFTLNTIGERCFYESGLKTVELWYDVTMVGDGAFARCANLTSIQIEGSERYRSYEGMLYEIETGSSRSGNILVSYPAAREDTVYSFPSDVHSMRPLAFAGCTHLEEVRMSDAIKGVSDSAFLECTGLKKVVLTDSVTSIDDMAFSGCTSLSEVVWSDRLSEIGYMSFAKTGFTKLVLPDNLRIMGSFCFEDCPDLVTAVLPGGLKNLGMMTFHECYKLERVTVGSNGTNFENSALSVGTHEHTEKTGGNVHITVKAPKNFHIPENVSGDYTDIDWNIEGDRPYPYENLAGVLICILVLFGITRMFREA